MTGKIAIVVAGVVVVATVAGTLAWIVVGGEPEDSTVPVVETPRVGADEGGNGARDAVDTPRRRDPVDPEPIPVAPPAAGEMWVTVEGMPEQLAAIDWPAMGAQLGDLVPILADVANNAAQGGAIESGTFARMSKLRRGIELPLYDLDAVLPSIYPIDVISHPVVAANAIAATLHARGMGLSAEQLAGLRERAAAANAIEVAAVAGESERTWRLTRAIAWYPRRSQFYASYDELLTDRQRRGLHSELSRDRVGLDVFSAAVMWESVLHVLLVTDPESTAIIAADCLLPGMGLDAERRDEAVALIRERVAALPDEMLSPDAGWMEVLGYMRGDDVVPWAAWSVDVILEVLIQASRGRLPPAPPDVLDRPAVLVLDPGR
jgi:hypothetical protein